MSEVGKFGSFAVTDPNAGVDGARRAWARVVAAWPERDMTEPALAKIAAKDIEAVLSAIPASAVDRSVMRFVGGEIGDPRFPPKLAEIAAEARRNPEPAPAMAKSRLPFERPRALPRPERSPEEIARRRAQAEEARRIVGAARLKTVDDAIRPRSPSHDASTHSSAPAYDAPASEHEAHALALAEKPLPRLSAGLVASFRKGGAG